MREVKQDPFCTFLHHLIASSSPSLLTKGILANIRLTLYCAPLLLKPCTSQGYHRVGHARKVLCKRQPIHVHCLAKLWAQPLCQLPLLQLG